MTSPPPQPVPRMTANTLARPAARAVQRLGQGQAVGVVRHADLAAQRGFEIVLERPAVEPGRIGIADKAGARAERAGHAEADSAGTDLALHRHDQIAHRQHGAVIAARIGDSLAQEERPRTVECGDLDLGAAKVDAEPGLRHDRHSPVLARRIRKLREMATV